MRGKDFEKQVQEKLEELRFAPSDAVWPQVEQQIARRKKRRILFWLFLLALTTGGSASLWYAADSDSSPFRKESAWHAHTDAKPAPSKTTAQLGGPGVDSSKWDPRQLATVPVPGTGSKADRASATKSPLLTAASTEKPDEVTNQKAGYEKGFTGHNHGPRNPAFSSRKTSGAGQNSKEYSQQAGANETAMPPVASEKVKTPDEQAQGAAGTNSQSIDNPGNEAKAVIADSPAVSAPVNQQATGSKKQNADSNSSLAKPPATVRKKSLNWGIQVAAGVSNILNGLSGSSDKMVFASSPNSSTSGNLNNNSVTGTVPAQRAGFAWSAGLSMKYPVGKKSTLVAGLQYNYFSSSMTVGAQQPSAFSQFQYARTGPGTDYTNHFHFLSVPVTMQRKLGKSRFALEGGAAISFLLASDALLYDSQKDLFTQAGGSITNPQVQLLAGFNYFIPHKAFSLELGPRFSYGLTNIFGAESTGARHLMYAGISAGIFFHHKK